MTLACPYCRGNFESRDAIQVCYACATPHHEDCFTENGGCSVFGCGNAPGDEPAIRVCIEDLAEHFAFDRRPAARSRAMEPPAWEPESLHADSGQHELRQTTPQFGIVLERAYPPAPSLPWGLLLFLSVFTGGLFLLIWDLTLAKWMREIQTQSRAYFYYCVVAGAHLVAVVSLIGGQISQSNVLALRLFAMVVFAFSLMGRFSLRKALEEYFDEAGPVGLSLGEGMTFFFGCLYFQYHLNRVMVMKRRDQRQQAIA